MTASASNPDHRKDWSRTGGRGLYVQNVDGCLDAAIGSHGLPPKNLTAALARLAPELLRLQTQYRDKTLPLLSIVDDTADIDAARAAYERLAAGARTVVFYGTGGSSLGGQTLAQVAGWNIPGGATAEQRGRPRTRFYDNLDARTLADALASLDLAATRFIVTSKSGGTAETLVQAVATLAAVQKAGLADRIPQMFLGLTEPARPGVANGLRGLFQSFGIPLIEHHTGIGGRYSALSNVGLIAAIARGLDPLAVRAGAKAVIDDLLAAATPHEFAPAIGAATAVSLAAERGIKVLPMMAYADRLGRFAHWYVQLWAESLGKAGKGTTPLAAVGPLDQHSQLQLFMEGARDHLLTIIRIANEDGGPPLDPELAKAAGIGFLGGRHVGELTAAQSLSVAEALRQAGRPVRVIDMPRLDERAIGGLMMHFMIETILAGDLLGVDPFDQPGVELAKRLAKQRLMS